MNYWKTILKSCSVIGILCLLSVGNGYSQNLLKNPGFETGIISPPWEVWIGDLNSVIAIDSNEVFSGSFSAKLSGEKVNLYQSVYFEPNAKYFVTAKIKCESNDSVYLGASDFGNDPVSIVFNSTGFETDSVAFTTGSDIGNNPRIFIWKPDGSGNVWVDDVSLTLDTVGRIPDAIGGLGIYYVSPDGSDSNAGVSPDEAWQTIDKVNHVEFKPGDKILFEGGNIFNGNIHLDYNDSGDLGNDVTLGSYGIGRATINAGAGTGLLVTDCNYIKIENLNFIGDGRNTGNTGNGIVLSFCSNIQVDSSDVSGFQHSGVKIKNEGSSFRLNRINAYDNGYAGIYVSGIEKSTLTEVYIGHCKTNNNPGDPTVLDNHSGNGIFVFNASKVLIEFCEASNNGWDMPRTGNGPGGIWVAEVDSAIIQSCISHNNKTSVGGQDGLGFDLDGGTSNSLIQYCLSYNNQGAGYGMFQYDGASEWKNNVIRYCISENDGNISGSGSVIFWNGAGTKDKFHGFEFYNNVIYNTKGPSLSFLDHKNSDFNFRNNIFVSETNGVNNYINGESFIANCWYPIDTVYYKNTINDFYNWANSTGQEMLDGRMVGIYADPGLINPGYSNVTIPEDLTKIEGYKLNDSSVVIDAGIDLKNLFNVDPGNRDFVGNQVNNGLAFDMGACEYKFVQQNVISFASGWNIFSIPGNSDTTDIQVIFQPVINRGTLVKVQDELGNSLEDWGIFGGWQNNIGNYCPNEGYKIKVIENDSIKIYSTLVQFPFAIPLSSGWNIIGYPQQNEFDAMSIVQYLIDKGNLVKVQDKYGNSIEDWGIFGGWQNNIGDFSVGNGYKIKVLADDTLSILNVYPKSGNLKPEAGRLVHFTKDFEGNGVDHMNINIAGLPAKMFKTGDELAVFDREKCVGAITLTQNSIKNQMASIVASASDNQGMIGFNKGNPIILKWWNSEQNKEYLLEPDVLKGALSFTENESVFVSLEKSAFTRLEGNQNRISPKINCYPNPFNNEITIEVQFTLNTQVSVEVLNQLGQKVFTLSSENTMNSGIHLFKWNGTDSSGQKISSGLYFIKVQEGDNIYYNKVMYKKQ